MPAATPAEAARYRAQVAEVKRQYTAGLVRAGLVWVATAGFGFASAIYQGFGGTEFLDSIEATRQEVLRLEEVTLPRILAGQRADGSTYVVELWNMALEQVTRRIEALTGEAWNASLFAAVTNVPHDTLQTGKEAAHATVKAVKEAVAPLLPNEDTQRSLVFWGKVTLGGVLAAAVLTPLARLVRGRE